MGKKIQNIGRYVMDGKTLGKGTFARVERATHSVTGCKVAIKVIDTRKIKEEHIKNNLHREARILGQLRHPNIVRLYETLKVTATTLYCLVMEFAGGGDLHVYIKSQKDCKLTEEVARPLMRQLVSAMHYLHERGVAHRDLKMENVMLDDKQKTIKLVDVSLEYLTVVQARLLKHWFRVSKYCSTTKLLSAVNWSPAATMGVEIFLGEGKTEPYLPENDAISCVKGENVGHWQVPLSGMTGHTRAAVDRDFGLSNTFTPDDLMHTHCGSPEYAAPELFDKYQKYGAEIDIWSLGIILYAMLMGHLPFETPYTDQYRRQKLQQQIERGLVHEHEREMSHMTQEGQDLLHKLIKVQAEQRLPLLDVEIHPWISLNATLPFFPFINIPRDKNMKHQTVDELSSLLDVNRKKLEPQLHEGKCDEMSAMFNMLLDRKRRDDGIFDIDYTVVKVENKKNDKVRKHKKDVKKDGSSKNDMSGGQSYDFSALNMIVAPPPSPCCSEKTMSSMRDSIKSTSSRKSSKLRVPITVDPPSDSDGHLVHESTTSANFDLLALCSTPSWLGPDRRKSRRKKKPAHSPVIAKEGTTATLAGAVSGISSVLAHRFGAPELTNSLQVPLTGNSATSPQASPVNHNDTNHLPTPPVSSALTRSNSLKAPSRKVTVTVNRTALSRENSLKVPSRQGRRRQSMFNFSHRESITKHAPPDAKTPVDEAQLHIRIDYSPTRGRNERKSSICIIQNVISPPASPVLNPRCRTESMTARPPRHDACDERIHSNDSAQLSSANCTPNLADNRQNDYKSLVIEQRRNSPVPRPVRLGIKDGYSQTVALPNPLNGPKSTSDVNRIECCNPCTDIMSRDYFSVSNSSEALLKGHDRYGRAAATRAKFGLNSSALCRQSNRRHDEAESSEGTDRSWHCMNRLPFFDATMLCSKMASLFPSYSASSPTIHGDSDSDSSDSLLESMQINNLATLSDKETPDVSGLTDDAFLRGFHTVDDELGLGSLWPRVTPAAASPPPASRTIHNRDVSKHECLSPGVLDSTPENSSKSQHKLVSRGLNSVTTNSPQLVCRKLTQQNHGDQIPDSTPPVTARINKSDMQVLQTVCKPQYPDVPCKERHIPPLLPECQDIPRQSPVLGVPSSQISLLSSTLQHPQRTLHKTPLARIESFTSNDFDDFQVCDSLGSTMRNTIRSKSPFQYLNRKDKTKVPKGKRRFSLKALMEKAHPNDKEYRLETCVSETLLECSSEHNSEKTASDSSTDKIPSVPSKAKVHPKGEQQSRGSLTTLGLNMDKSPSRNISCHSTDLTLNSSQISPANKPSKNNKLKSISKSAPWKRNFANFLRKRKSSKNICEKSTEPINMQHSSFNSNGHARIPAGNADTPAVNNSEVCGCETVRPISFHHTVTDTEECSSIPTPTHQSVKVFDFPNMQSQCPHSKPRFLTWGRCRECTRSHSSSEEGSESAVSGDGNDIKLNPLLSNCRRTTQDLPQANACC